MASRSIGALPVTPAQRRFAARLGYSFNESGLFVRALTHRSMGPNNNERLEFLGDAILTFLVRSMCSTGTRMRRKASSRVCAPESSGARVSPPRRASSTSAMHWCSAPVSGRPEATTAIPSASAALRGDHRSTCNLDSDLVTCRDRVRPPGRLVRSCLTGRRGQGRKDTPAGVVAVTGEAVADIPDSGDRRRRPLPIVYRSLSGRRHRRRHDWNRIESKTCRAGCSEAHHGHTR